MKTKATTAEYYPVILEQETNGTWSAYVAGLPGVYAAATPPPSAKRAIRDALAAHLGRFQTRHVRATNPKCNCWCCATRTGDCSTSGLGSLLGRKTSALPRLTAARENGRKVAGPRLHISCGCACRTRRRPGLHRRKVTAGVGTLPANTRRDPSTDVRVRLDDPEASAVEH